MADGQRHHDPLDRARRVSLLLAESARLARRSGGGRRGYDIGAFRRRAGSRALRVFALISFVVVALLPSLAAAIYYGFVASPQFLVEARFVVQGGEPSRTDGLGEVTGLPPIRIAQDTQVVASYMQSRSIVEALEERVGLSRIYGASDIDWFARFNRDRSVEKLVDHWKAMTDVSIQMTSGIVTFEVRAFSAETALMAAREAVSLSEALVNELNDRMRRDTLSAAQADFERAATRMVRARLELERTRNAEGMLDAGQTGKSLADLVTSLQAERLRLRQDYDSQRGAVSAEAPHMRAMNVRLRALTEQILELEARLTRPVAAAAPDRALSQSMTRFSELDLERRIAEKQYASAVAALETARSIADRKLIYLATFMRPTLPGEPRRPRRTLMAAMIAAGAVAAWGCMVGAAVAIRNHAA